MLYYSTIYPETLRLLKALQEIDFLKNYRLVGGTALALQIGHRISVDLDLFSFSESDVALIPDHIETLGRLKIVNHTPNLLNLFIDEIKVDFVSYRYDFIKPVDEIENIRLASIEDIAAMKLAAIIGRGAKKDFIDLFFLLKDFSLYQLFEFYRQKYPDGSDFLLIKSLTYFDDADVDPMPKMLNPLDWNQVKSGIVREVKKFFP